MSCSKWHGQIALLVGGDLEMDRVPDLERHLETCGACRDLERELRRDLQDLGRLDVAAGLGTELGSVRGQVLQQVAKRGRPRIFPAVPRPLLATAAVAALVLLAVILSPWSPAPEPRQARHVEPPPPMAVQPTEIAVVPEASPTEIPREVEPRETAPVEMAHTDPPSSEPMAAPTVLASTEPMTIKILTDDPEVVIYWIVDPKGDNENA